MPNESLRYSALNHEALGLYNRVKVLFRTPRGDLFGYWMDRETYAKIPLGQQATVDDYRAFGQVDEAQNTDIYSPL